MRLRTIGLISTLVLGLLVRPLPAEAQKPGKVYRIGWLGSSSANLESDFTSRFEVGLADLGWVRGQNFVMEYRWAKGKYERFPDLTAELVQIKVDVILAVGTVATRAAMNATKTIPIVFTLVGNPVASGFVASLARPGGNVTGMTNLLPGLAGKQLELLKETVPDISRVAVLRNPTNPDPALIFEQMLGAAQALGVSLQSVEMRGLDDLGPAFSAMTRERADALIVVADEVTVSGWWGYRKTIVHLALKNRLPTMSNWPLLTLTGGSCPMRRAMVLCSRVRPSTWTKS